MSKFVKVSDVKQTLLEMSKEKTRPVGWGDVLMERLKDLSIEVSEEVLKATKKFNAYTIADENAEMGMRTQIEPIIEVSEDCISREYALKVIDDCINYPTNGDKACAIKNAPSVIPTAKEGEWVDIVAEQMKGAAE